MVHVSENAKHIIDTISVGTVIATLTTWLPPIAALLSIIWTALRLWEMITGKPITNRHKQKRQDKNVT